VSALCLHAVLGEKEPKCLSVLYLSFVECFLILTIYGSDLPLSVSSL